MKCEGGVDAAGVAKTSYTDKCEQDSPPVLYSKIVDYSGCEGKEIKYQMPSSKGLSDIYVDGTVPEGGSGKGFIFLVEMLIISFAVLLYA